MLREGLALALGVVLAAAARGGRGGAPPVAGRWTQRQLEALAREAGWSGDDARIAAAIAMAESRGNPRAQLVTSREDSRGLWAINTRAWPKADPARLFEPRYNATTARAVWVAAGKGGRDPWRPWSVWAYDHDGTYRGPGRGAVRAFL